MELIKTIIPVDPTTLSKWMKQMSTVLTLVRLMVGLLFSGGVAMASVVIWVNHKTEQIDSTQLKIAALEKDNSDRLHEWTMWRQEMDRMVTRLLTVQEQQQKLMERLTDKVDRRP